MDVPFLDLKAQHAPLRNEILAAWETILDSCHFVGGEHVEGFEREFAEACGVPHCVAVSSGTDALLLGLKALGVEAGDEVIVPANTFIATAEAVSNAGATPVFVDVCRGTWNIDPACIAVAVTPRTKGVIGVHLYGQPFDVDPVRKVCDQHGLWLMEDSAQAHLSTYNGRRTGALAGCAAFSFYPGKNLGAPGEGGAFVTQDAGLADTVRRLRDHGQAAKYRHELVGFNARLPALMASALRVKLRSLPGWNAARREHARRYCEALAGIHGIELPVEIPAARGNYHLFVVHVQERDSVLAAMKDAGVGCALHYPIPCHLQACYKGLGYPPGALPVAEYNAANCLSLPMFAELTSAQIEYVAENLRNAMVKVVG